jgi:hypothetical protein
MRWISLGQTCLASYHLRRFGLQRNETHFFDWIITSQTTVIKILEMKDQDELRKALTENVEFERDLFEGHKAFTCPKLSLRSVHDLPTNGDRPDIFQLHFVDKYLRRYNRLIDVLRQAAEPVVFVITLKKHEPMDQLLNTIQHRFPNLEFHLFLIVEEKANHDKDHERVTETTVFLEDYLLTPEAQQTHWSLDQYDWENIFSRFLSTFC